MTTRTLKIIAGLTIAAGASSASATNYSINWLDMSPTPFGSAPASGSVFPFGSGTVTMTYTSNAAMSQARVDQSFDFGSASVTNGPDTYSWGAYESFGRTVVQPQPPLNQQWSITYTFSNTINAGDLVVGISGLGRRDLDDPNAVTIAECFQNGTYLGQHVGAGPWGNNVYTPGASYFRLENQSVGSGGANPHWNTALALVRIDDTVNSLTVFFDQTSGDGVGLNIGSIVPSPSSLALLAGGTLLTLRRRR